jgi:hypothetical protein
MILKKVESSAFQVVNNESYDKLGLVVETCALVDGGGDSACASMCMRERQDGTSVAAVPFLAVCPCGTTSSWLDPML